MDYQEFRIYGKKKGPTIAVVGNIHGTEYVGTFVVNKLKEISIDYGLLRLVIANPKAKKENKYFIEKNLNGSFPGNVDGAYEERLAFYLQKELSTCNFVIDLHSIDKSEGENMIITTSLSKRHKELMNYLELKKILFVDPKKISYAKNSFVNNIMCGVSLEYYESGNKKKMLEQAYQDVLLFLKKTELFEKKETNTKRKKVIYRVVDTLLLPSKKYIPNNSLVDGELVKTGTLLASSKKDKIFAKKDFYPVLLKKKLNTKNSTRMCFMANKEMF